MSLNMAEELKALKITVKCLTEALDPAAKAKFHKSIGAEIKYLLGSASGHGSDLSNQELSALREIAFSLGYRPTS